MTVQKSIEAGELSPGYIVVPVRGRRYLRVRACRRSQEHADKCQQNKAVMDQRICAFHKCKTSCIRKCGLRSGPRRRRCNVGATPSRGLSPLHREIYRARRKRPESFAGDAISTLTGKFVIQLEP